MMIAIRGVLTTWKGSLATGSGELTSASEALDGTEVTSPVSTSERSRR